MRWMDITKDDWNPRHAVRPDQPNFAPFPITGLRHDRDEAAFYKINVVHREIPMVQNLPRCYFDTLEQRRQPHHFVFWQSAEKTISCNNVLGDICVGHSATLHLNPRLRLRQFHYRLLRIDE